MALVFFAILEGAFSQQTLWDSLCDSGTDLCNLSIGIVGGLFFNTPLQTRLGQGSAVVAISLVLLNLILAASVMLVNRRLTTMPLNYKAYISIFLGVLAVALPTGLIVKFGA